MKRLIALLICLSTPALAQGEVTILRGSSAPPPPPVADPAPTQVIVVEQPYYPYYSQVLYPPFVSRLPVRQHPHPQPHPQQQIPNGWPLLRR